MTRDPAVSLASNLLRLNGGFGVRLSDGHDLRITGTDGATFDVNFDPQSQVTVDLLANAWIGIATCSRKRSDTPGASTSSLCHASPSTPAVIEPPDTEDTRCSEPSSPCFPLRLVVPR